MIHGRLNYTGISTTLTGTTPETAERQMHAPEPWTRVRSETPDYYVYEIHAGSGHVASIAGWTDFATVCPTTEANARLLCKAPAMLRVLKELLEWSALTGGWNAPCWEEATAILACLQAPPSSDDTEGAAG